MRAPRNWAEAKESLEYLFLRNKDISKEKTFLNIMKLLFKRFRLWRAFKKNSLIETQRSYTRRKNQSWCILWYERICNPESCPIPVGPHAFVRPETFEMHCEALTKTANVISLSKLCEILSNGEVVPDGTVVLTLDGGFGDQYRNATQAITKYSLSPTLSIPTAYIGNSTFLLEDRLAIALNLFDHNKVPIGTFEAFNEKMKADFANTLNKKGIPTPKALSTLFGFYLVLPTKERALLMEELGEKLKHLPLGMPDWLDFMTWDEVQKSHSFGSEIIHKLHTCPPTWGITKEDFLSDIMLAEHELKHHGFTHSPILSLPYGLYTQGILDWLQEAEYQYALSNHLPDSLLDQDHEVKVLNRLSVCEGNSFSKELFLGRVWDL